MNIFCIISITSDLDALTSKLGPTVRNLGVTFDSSLNLINRLTACFFPATSFSQRSNLF